MLRASASSAALRDFEVAIAIAYQTALSVNPIDKVDKEHKENKEFKEFKHFKIHRLA